MRTSKSAWNLPDNRNAKVITLTDSVHSPDEPVFFLQSDRKKRYGIYCGFPGGSAECDQRTDRRPVHENNRVRWLETLEALEDIWNEYQVYESDEINYIDDHMKMRYGKVDNVDREDSGIEK